MNERCRHGLDRRWCADCNRPAAPNRPSTSSRPSTADPHSAANICLTWQFKNDGHTLVLVADLVKGWRCEKRTDQTQRKTYCYSELVSIPWQAGRISCQVSLFPRPGALAPEWGTPPLLKWEGRRANKRTQYLHPETNESGLEEWEDCCVIRFDEGSLDVTVDLFNSAGTWHEGFRPRANGAGHQMYEHLADYPTFGLGCPYSSIDLQVRLTFIPPSKPAPIERSFWNDFLPGGRPESNRRRF